MFVLRLIELEQIKTFIRGAQEEEDRTNFQQNEDDFIF